MSPGGTALSLALVLSLGGCTVTPQRDALAAAARYSRALDTHDFEAAVRLADPEIVKRVPEDKLRELLETILVPKDGSVASVHDEVHGVSNEFADSVGLHYFVPNRRVTRMTDGDEVEFENYYIAPANPLRAIGSP